MRQFPKYPVLGFGDGLLVYFGYPLAHEDDAQRAVRAGLGMIEAVRQLTAHLTQARGVQLAVRLGSIPGWWWWATSPGKPLGILRLSQPKREEQRPAQR